VALRSEFRTQRSSVTSIAHGPAGLGLGAGTATSKEPSGDFRDFGMVYGMVDGMVYGWCLAGFWMLLAEFSGGFGGFPCV
jgi:hypothetical protein